MVPVTDELCYGSQTGGVVLCCVEGSCVVLGGVVLCWVSCVVLCQTGRQGELCCVEGVVLCWGSCVVLC